MFSLVGVTNADMTTSSAHANSLKFRPHSFSQEDFYLWFMNLHSELIFLLSLPPISSRKTKTQKSNTIKYNSHRNKKRDRNRARRTLTSFRFCARSCSCS